MSADVWCVADAGTGMDRASTAELASRARAGDQHAWNEIVDRFAPLLWSTCMRFRLSSADAADACQGTWLRLVENLEGLREDAALPGWIATTAYRECLHVAKTTHERERRRTG
ncbi:MAG: hypothetical protein L0K86_28285, partial [Actinomycetia bacterium]|nr:hypothetical protein [Actinomycetes bacterium]